MMKAEKRSITAAIVVVLALLVASCVKETFDLNKVDETISYSPSLVLSAASGKVTLIDILKPNDTIVYDESDLLKIIFREDSVFSFEMEELIDLDDIFSFSESYSVGAVSLDDDVSLLEMTLGFISNYLDPVLRDQLQALDDGDPHPFPEIPATSLGSHSFDILANYEHATFTGGRLEVTVTNGLNAPLSGAQIAIYDSDNDMQIGSDLFIPAIGAGESHTDQIALTGRSMSNSLYATITLNGSPGTSDPVIISMDDLVSFTVEAKDMEVSSGRVILPEQLLVAFEDEETVSFDPGDDIEITEFRIEEGSVDYTITSNIDLDVDIDLVMPTFFRNGVPFSENIYIGTNSVVSGSFDADGLHGLFDTDPLQPFNRFPVNYNITVSSNGLMVDFNMSDEIAFDIEMGSPTIDFVKGYFGHIVEDLESDTIDLEIEEFLELITGDFYLADPSIAIEYQNSFVVPLQLNIEAEGKREGEPPVQLGLAPFTISYPDYPSERDRSDVFIINRDNSSLPELISLPPGEMILGGSATLNPGGNSGARDNVIFGDSRITGNMEVTLPFDFYINNLTFADTLENFMKLDEDSDDEITPDDFDQIRLDLTVENGFPLGVTVRFIFYDSETDQQIHALSVPGDGTDIMIFEPAPVNAEGRATGITEKLTRILIDREFFDASQQADSIIIEFTLNTTGSGSQSVKIYSDYSIGFKAAVAVKPNITITQ